ncbi:hypothetical protein TURU_036716 [Turdus rufiventris]|nr:hypothetical protein TURU_036716 [Turdus rufiventris]
MHRQQHRTTQDAVIPIHNTIRELENQGVVSKAHSPFNSPIWPVCKSDGEWRLTAGYRALNEVTLLLSAAVPDMLEVQYELEYKAAKWYTTTDIANAFFCIPLAAECRPQFAFTWKGMQYIWNQLPQGWKHSPITCHGLIQVALEKSEAPKQLQYTDNTIVWGREYGQDRMWRMCSTLLLVCPGAFGRRCLVKLEVGHSDFGVEVTEGPKPTTFQLRRKSWLPVKEFKLPQRDELEVKSSRTESHTTRLHKLLKEKVDQVNLRNSKLDIAEREKWPKFYLYTDSWIVANALWGWLERWKKAY